MKIYKVKNYKQYWGHKLLWYLQKTVDGKKFPNFIENILGTLYYNAITKITLYLLKESVFNDLILFDTKDFFIKIPGPADSRQMSKIRQLVENYDATTRKLILLIKHDSDNADYYNLLDLKSQEILSELKKIKLSKYTMNRLIGSVLGIDWGVRNKYKYQQSSKYVRKMLNLLYHTNKDLFLSNFKNGE